MKDSKTYPVQPLTIKLISCITLLILLSGCSKLDYDLHTPELTIRTVASGLTGPMGIETDDHGNIWTTESGTDAPNINNNTHNNNGKVILITSDGQKHDAIVNLESYANVHSGELQGTVHILMDGGMLYVISGDHLYHTDVSNFMPGDAPLDASKLPSENIAAIVSQLPSESNPDHDSHSYNLTKGPEGDLYIADAGANAIVHRRGENDYSIFAEIPAIPNPSFPDLGEPTVQSVPTSILYNGSTFLVTTLTGFPFPAREAIIYEVSVSGDISVYLTGFTMLVDLVEGKNSKHLVTQYASSFNPATGFEPSSGSLIWTDGSENTLLVDGLNQPVGIKQVDGHTWYVTSLGDGEILKVTYR